MAYRIVERAERDRLGEGVVWVASRNALFWVDIVKPAVYSLSSKDGQIRTLAVDEPVGWIIPVADSNWFMAGFASGFWLLDFDTGERRFVGNPEEDRPNNRMNDAKVDTWGRIWAGTKDDMDQQKSGALYRLDPDLQWTRMDDHYGVTNGPAFSLDGRTMFHTDSPARTVYAFDLDANGSLSNKRVWLTFADEWGYPDGMTTDAQGCIWIAHWGGGRVSRFSPEGEWMQSIALPATNITNCAFAGNDLDCLFVTSSTIGHEDEAHAGALFVIEPGVTGLQPRPFHTTSALVK